MLVLRSAMTFLFFVMLECNACAQYEATNGMLQCGFSNFVYEVKLTETKKLSHGVCLFCSINGRITCGEHSYIFLYRDKETCLYFLSDCARKYFFFCFQSKMPTAVWFSERQTAFCTLFCLT